MEFLSIVRDANRLFVAFLFAALFAFNKKLERLRADGAHVFGSLGICSYESNAISFDCWLICPLDCGELIVL